MPGSLPEDLRRTHPDVITAADFEDDEDSPPEVIGAADFEDELQGPEPNDSTYFQNPPEPRAAPIGVGDVRRYESRPPIYADPGEGNQGQGGPSVSEIARDRLSQMAPPPGASPRLRELTAQPVMGPYATIETNPMLAARVPNLAQQPVVKEQAGEPYTGAVEQIRETTLQGPFSAEQVDVGALALSSGAIQGVPALPYGVAKALLETGNSLGSAENVALLAGARPIQWLGRMVPALSAATKVAYPIAERALQGVFQTMMMHGATEGAELAAEAAGAGDTQEALYQGTHAATSVAMAVAPTAKDITSGMVEMPNQPGFPFERRGRPVSPVFGPTPQELGVTGPLDNWRPPPQQPPPPPAGMTAQERLRFGLAERARQRGFQPPQGPVSPVFEGEAAPAGPPRQIPRGIEDLTLEEPYGMPPEAPPRREPTMQDVEDFIDEVPSAEGEFGREPAERIPYEPDPYNVPTERQLPPSSYRPPPEPPEGGFPPPPPPSRGPQGPPPADFGPAYVELEPTERARMRQTRKTAQPFGEGLPGEAPPPGEPAFELGQRGPERRVATDWERMPEQELRQRARRMEEELTQAETDPLTELPTRRAHERYLAENPGAWHAALDADGLKAINDTHGHKAGDMAIRAVADMLRTVEELTGTRFFRTGGDEFSGVGERKLMENALPKVQAALDQGYVEVEGLDGSMHRVKIGVSYGIGAERQAADAALYEQKRGRKAAREIQFEPESFEGEAGRAGPPRGRGQEHPVREAEAELDTLALAGDDTAAPDFAAEAAAREMAGTPLTRADLGNKTAYGRRRRELVAAMGEYAGEVALEGEIAKLKETGMERAPDPAKQEAMRRINDLQNPNLSADLQAQNAGAPAGFTDTVQAKLDKRNKGISAAAKKLRGEKPEQEVSEFESTFRPAGPKRGGLKDLKETSDIVKGEVTTWTGELDGKPLALKITVRAIDAGMDSFLTSSNMRLSDTGAGKFGAYIDVEVVKGSGGLTEATKQRLRRMVERADSEGRPVFVRLPGEAVQGGGGINVPKAKTAAQERLAKGLGKKPKAAPKVDLEDFAIKVPEFGAGNFAERVKAAGGEAEVLRDHEGNFWISGKKPRGFDPLAEPIKLGGKKEPAPKAPYETEAPKPGRPNQENVLLDRETGELYYDYELPEGRQFHDTAIGYTDSEGIWHSDAERYAPPPKPTKKPKVEPKVETERGGAKRMPDELAELWDRLQPAEDAAADAADKYGIDSPEANAAAEKADKLEAEFNEARDRWNEGKPWPANATYEDIKARKAKGPRIGELVYTEVGVKRITGHDPEAKKYDFESLHHMDKYPSAEWNGSELGATSTVKPEVAIKASIRRLVAILKKGKDYEGKKFGPKAIKEAEGKLAELEAMLGEPRFEVQKEGGRWRIWDNEFGEGAAYADTEAQAKLQAGKWNRAHNSGDNVYTPGTFAEPEAREKAKAAPKTPAQERLAKELGITPPLHEVDREGRIRAENEFREEELGHVEGDLENQMSPEEQARFDKLRRHGGLEAVTPKTEKGTETPADRLKRLGRRRTQIQKEMERIEDSFEVVEDPATVKQLEQRYDELKKENYEVGRAYRDALGQPGAVEPSLGQKALNQKTQEELRRREGMLGAEEKVARKWIDEYVAGDAETRYAKDYLDYKTGRRADKPDSAEVKGALQIENGIDNRLRKPVVTPQVPTKPKSEAQERLSEATHEKRVMEHAKKGNVYEVRKQDGTPIVRLELVREGMGRGFGLFKVKEWLAEGGEFERGDYESTNYWVKWWKDRIEDSDLKSTVTDKVTFPASEGPFIRTASADVKFLHPVEGKPKSEAAGRLETELQRLGRERIERQKNVTGQMEGPSAREKELLAEKMDQISREAKARQERGEVPKKLTKAEELEITRKAMDPAVVAEHERKTAEFDAENRRLADLEQNRRFEESRQRQGEAPNVEAMRLVQKLDSVYLPSAGHQIIAGITDPDLAAAAAKIIREGRKRDLQQFLASLEFKAKKLVTEFSPEASERMRAEEGRAAPAEPKPKPPAPKTGDMFGEQSGKSKKEKGAQTTIDDMFGEEPLKMGVRGSSIRPSKRQGPSAALLLGDEQIPIEQGVQRFDILDESGKPTGTQVSVTFDPETRHLDVGHMGGGEGPGSLGPGRVRKVLRDLRDHFDAETVGGTHISGAKMEGEVAGGEVSGPAERLGKTPAQRRLSEKLGKTPRNVLQARFPRAQHAGKIAPEPLPKGEKQLRPRQIMRLMSESFGKFGFLPIKTGHYRQQAHGITKIPEHVIRLDIADDLQVAGHELGHHIQESELGLPIGGRAPQYAAELTKLGLHTSSPSMDAVAIQREGTAEFMRRYLLNPDEARRLAPSYAKAFEAALDARPELKKPILQLQRQMRGHYAKSASERVKSKIDFEGEEEGLDNRQKLQKAMTRGVDDLQALNNAVRTMKGKKQSLNVTEDAAAIAALSRGAHGKAMGFLEFGVQTSDGKIISPAYARILKMVKGRKKDFSAYLVSKRVVEDLSTRGLEAGVEYRDAVETVREMEGKHAGFKSAAELIYKYEDGLLQYGLREGAISRELYDRIRKMNPYHVPFYRVRDTVAEAFGAQMSGKFADRGSPIKRYKGSGLDIIDPLESIIRNTEAMTNMVEHHKAALALANQANKTIGGGRFMERIPVPMEAQRINLKDLEGKIRQILSDAGIDLEQGIDFDEMVTAFTPAMFSKEKGIVTVLREGKREWYSVNEPGLYDALTMVGPRQEKILMALLEKPTRVLRAGATLSISFIARNPIRDTFAAAMQSNYGFIPVVDTVRGLAEYMKKGEVYREFMNSGAANAAFISADRNMIRRAIREMAHDRKIRDSIVLHPIELLRALSEASENSTRIGLFMRALAKEGRTKEGYARAALEARRNPVDFARGGSSARAWNRVSAFFNAEIQGLARTAETMKQHPLRTMAIGTAALTMPSLAAMYLNKDDKDYKNIPDWEKNKYWHIPAGGEEGGFYRIPKPYGPFGTIFCNLPEAFIRHVQAKDPDALDRLFPDKDTAWDSLNALVPTALMPLMESYSNFDTYRRQPIVSPWDEHIDPELQANRWTSELAKYVAPKMGMAPAKFDHLINGYTAGLGNLAVKALDWPIRQITGNPAKPAFNLNPFYRPKPAADAEVLRKFYKRLDEIEGASRSAKLYREQGRRKEAFERLMKEGRGFKNESKRMHKAAKDISEIRDDVNKTFASTTLSRDEKRRELTKIYQRMIRIATNAMPEWRESEERR